MSRLALREYQTHAISLVRRAYLAGKRAVLLVLPTGAGKTATASELIRVAVGRGKRVIFLVHRREIVLDTARRLAAAGVPAGVVMADEPVTRAPVQVCSVQTLIARGSFPAADLVIWDECHHVAAESYRTIRAQYPAAHHLGLTATPERADGDGLGDAFEELVAPIGMRELVELGYLAPIDVIAPARRITGALAIDPADAYRREGAGRPAVIFCATVAASQACVDGLNASGVRAAHLDGETPAAERDALLRRFERGDLDVISNVFVLTEGWDSARAEVCIIARGCGSLCTYLQTIGRVRRKGDNPDKRCLLIDLAGAVHEHGMPDADRGWTLKDGQGAPKSEREWLAQCLACGFVAPGVSIRRGADRLRHCPRCSAVLAGVDPLEVKNERIARVDAASLAPSDTKERALRDLMSAATARGYAPGWAAHKFKARFGHWPERRSA